VRRKRDGVTRPASRASHAGRPRAALASGRGPWPCSLASGPLGRPEKGPPVGGINLRLAEGPGDRSSSGPIGDTHEASRPDGPQSKIYE
jgi:hypothetical protein